MSRKLDSVSVVPSNLSPKARRYSEESKRDSVRLVTGEKYSFQAAATVVGVSQKSLRDWHAKFAPPPAPCGEHASMEDLREENRGCVRNSSGPRWNEKS